MTMRTRHEHPCRERHIHIARKTLEHYLSQRVAAAPSALRAERVPAIAALLAAAAWRMPVEGRKALADLGLAIYAFDDVVDESEIPVSDLELRAEQLVACAASEPCPEVLFDPTAGLLRDVAERLADAPLATALWRDWARASAACFRGMVGHRRVAEDVDAGRGVSLDEYLALGRDSMGVVAACIAAAIVEGDPRPVLNREAFLAAAGHAALAARIANDLRTVERERIEGSINALLLPGVTVPALISRMRTERAAAERILAAVPGGCGPAGRFILDFVDGIIAIYDRCDFHQGAEALRAVS